MISSWPCMAPICTCTYRWRLGITCFDLIVRSHTSNNSNIANIVQVDGRSMMVEVDGRGRLTTSVEPRAQPSKSKPEHSAAGGTLTLCLCGGLAEQYSTAQQRTAITNYTLYLEQWICDSTHTRHNTHTHTSSRGPSYSPPTPPTRFATWLLGGVLPLYPHS